MSNSNGCDVAPGPGEDGYRPPRAKHRRRQMRKAGQQGLI